MSSTTLAFDILARDRASRTFTTVGRSAETSSRGVRLLGSAMKYTALGVAGGVTALAGLSIKLGKSAADDQVSARNLALQMRNSADATRGQIAATEDWISAQGKALGVTDDELRPALGKLVAATDSVTKARRLTSLAEDIAAGRGKSLSTVTEALAKAQLGSLSGLSRLGVRTKDAAGETLSLKEITEDLARTYDGQAAKAADTASGRYNRLKVMLTETGEAIGYKLLPPATEFAGWLLDKGIPRAEEFAHTLEAELGQTIRDVGGWIKSDGIDLLHDFGNVLTDDVIPATKEAGQIVGDAVGFFQDLPDPVRKVGIEAGIAALVVPRLSGAVGAATSAVKTNVDSLRTWRTEMATTEGVAGRATTTFSRLGGAAKTAAGIGGMVALTEGANQSNAAIETLTNVGGGALLGFSVGGPWGAAVGGTAGALMTLAKHAKYAGNQIEIQVPKFDDMKDTLDDLTAATTEATKASIMQGLESNGTLDILNQYGISSRTVVNGVIGETKARDMLRRAVQSEAAQRNAALKEASRLQREYNSVVGTGTAEENRRQELSGLIRGYREEAAAHDQVVQSIQSAIGKRREDTRSKREEIAATKDYTGLLKGLPKRVRTDVQANGIEPTRKAVVDLAHQYKLTPKQIKTVLKAAGFEGTEKQIEGVKGRIKELNGTRPDLTPALRAVTQFSMDAKREAIAGATQVADSLKKGTGKARADLRPFSDSVRTGSNTAAGIARPGGDGVGRNLGGGMLSGISATAPLVVQAAQQAVRDAIAAARREGDIKSPSRKMQKIGQQLGDGMAVGLRARRTQIATSGADLIRQLVHGIGKEERPLKTVLDRVSGYVDTWQSKLKSLQADSRSFAAGFQSFTTSVFSADLTDPTSGAGPTVNDILGFAKDERAQAKQLRANVAKLQRAGLSDSLLKQLQASGASGIAQIQALASNASAAEIRQLSALDKATRGDLRATGGRAAQQIYGAQIRNAQQNVAAGRKVEDLLEKIEKHLRDAKGDIYIDLEGRTIKTSQRDHDKKHRRG